MIYLNDALKKGYMINDTLDLSSRVMSLETAKEIMNKCTNVSGKTLSFSEDTWGLILSDDDAIEILEGIYSKGWNSNEPDIQIIAASGYNGKVNYNGSEQTLTQSAVNSNLWMKSSAGSITSLDCFSGMSSTDSSTYYNSTAVKIQKVRFGKNINTASCTTIRRMFRGASTSNIQFRKGDFRHLNTSSVTNMNAVFGEIETDGEIIDLIGLENWNTSNVTNFNFMFAGQTCTGTLDLHTWRIKSGATITSMFQYLDPMASRGCTPKFYYTPGYWSVDPMSDSNLAANVVKPVVYPYHDINVAAASGFNGQMYKDTALVNMTKDNTLGIWYYDFSSSYTFSTNSVRSLFRNNVNSTVTDNLYSVSFKKDAFSIADDASLDTFGMFLGCRALRSFDAEALSNKMTTGGYQMWNMGTASSSSLTTMHLPEFTQNYGYSATFQHCNSIRYAKFPTIKNASGYFASIFYGCTNLIRITNMPGILNGANTTNAFTGCSALTTIDACGPISETIDMSASPLSLASAKVILEQLQTVTSETISFSNTTWGYILGDDEAIELLESAYNRGWNSNEPDIQITAASGYNGIVRVNAANKTLTQSTSNTELWYGSAGTVTALDFFLEHNNSSSAPAYNSTSTNIKKVRFGKNINTASCTTIGYAFGCASSNCTNLTKIDVRHLNTANVTSMRGTFANWNYLPLKEILGLENFNTGKVTDFQNMFLSSYIKNKTIDLKGWHVLSSANVAAMFGTLSGYANMQISVCFFYTPGYWAKDPLTNISGSHCKPVVYPYHDITVAANSSYTGVARVNGSNVTLTKNSTLGIWYYDIPEGTEITTLDHMIDGTTTVANGVTSVSVSGINESSNGVNLNSFGSRNTTLYTAYFGIKKIKDNIAWMFDYGNSGSAPLNSFYGLEDAEAPNDTYIVDIVRGCPVLRFVCLPKMSGRTSNSQQPFRDCTNLIWISNLPGIKQEDTNFCYGCSSLTRISEASPIYETVSFADSPLRLASAKVILRQLQTVVSETCTFSSTTLGYINNDNEALNLVSIARGRGWNIPGATVIGGTIKGTVTSGTSSISLKINNTVTSIPCSNGSFSYQIDSAVTSLNDFINNQSSILTIDFSELGTATVTDWTNMMAGFEGTSANFSNMIIKEGSTTTGIFGNFSSGYIISAADNMEILEAFDMYPLANLLYHSIEEAQDNAKLILKSLGSPSSTKTLNFKSTEIGTASYAYVVVGYYPRGGFNLMDLVWEKRGLGWNILMPELMIYSQAYTENWRTWDGRVMINGSVQTMTYTYGFIDNVGNRYRCWYMDTISNKSNITSMKDFIMSMWGAGFYNELVQNIRNILFPTSISMPNLTLMKYMFGFDDDGPATLRIVDMRGLSTGTQAKNVNNMFNTKTVSEVIYLGDVDISNMGIDDSISFGNNNIIYYKAGKIAQSVINAYPNNTWIEVQ